MVKYYSNVQILPKLPLQLRWRRGPDMPFKMSGYVQSVIVQGTVYVGGGSSGQLDNHHIVMTYDTSSGKWAKLPPYRAWGFAMTVTDNLLALVGGWDGDDVVGVWRADSKEWTHPYPDMPTPRAWCSAVVHKGWLVVAGGQEDGGADLSSVEVLNTDTKQWFSGFPTPIPWSGMRSAIVGDVCYFMGGYICGSPTNTVYTVSLPVLTSQLNSGVRDSQIWKKISGPQAKGLSPLSSSGSLLAIGGWYSDRSAAVSTIHLYQPETGEWVKVEDLPTSRYNCTCVMLTDKELLVAGGFDGDKLKRVDIALVD